MSGINFFIPLQTKCYRLKNKGKNHSLLWIGGHRDYYEKPVSKSLLVPTDGPKAGEESVAVRGADMWALGLQKYRRGRGKEGSPERFLRTQQGPIRPRFTLPLGLPGATMATVQ